MCEAMRYLARKSVITYDELIKHANVFTPRLIGHRSVSPNGARSMAFITSL